MKAVILAAGKGTRLQPLTYTKPKVLIPIANKPIIQYIVENLIEVGVDEIFIITNHLEGKVKAFFNEWRPNVKVTFVHQEKLGGTGDALKTVAGRINLDFILTNGDEIFEKNPFIPVIEKFKEEDVMAVIGGAETEHPEMYGALLTNVSDELEKIFEKDPNPQTNLVNAGVYMFSPKVFDYLERISKSARGEYELTDAIMQMSSETNRVFVAKVGKWHTMSMLWDIFDANEMKLEHRIKKENSGNNIMLGNNVEIKPGVYIEGNVAIGDDSVIGPNCYIRGTTSIGRNCRIGNGVEIKNCIIMDNSNVPHLSYIGDSVIGEHCNMGAGTISGNLRHDHKNVKVLVKEEVIESNGHKLGFFASDFTKTGIGTMIYPGMKLGPFSWTTPNATVDCNVEPFTILSSGGKKKIPKEKIDTAIKGAKDKEFLKDMYDELKDVKY